MWPGVLGFQQQEVEGLEEGEVATGLDVQEAVGDLGAPSDDPPWLLRVLEAPYPGLGQHDAGAVAFGLLQGRQLARMVGAGVLSHQEDEFGVVEIVEADGAPAGAQRLAQGEATGLMAHVAAVGQVVGAEGAGEELQDEGGLIAGPARRVEGGLVRGGERGEFPGEHTQGVVQLMGS